MDNAHLFSSWYNCWQQATINFLHELNLRRNNFDTGTAWALGVWTKWGSHLIRQNYVWVRDASFSMVIKSSNARLFISSYQRTSHFLKAADEADLLNMVYKLRVNCHLFPLCWVDCLFFMRWCRCDASCWSFRYSLLKLFFCVDLNLIAGYRLWSLGIPETEYELWRAVNLLASYVISHS